LKRLFRCCHKRSHDRHLVVSDTSVMKPFSKKVLLLNPPGRRNFGRDYYCSKVNKADYVEHPVDLVYLTGILERHVEYLVIDAIVDKLDSSACIERILAFSPDVIVFLSGWVSWIEDFQFLAAVKKHLPASSFIGMGDLFLDRDVFLKHDWIDAVLYDFRNGDLLEYLSGKVHAVSNMIVRHQGSLIDGRSARNTTPGTFRSLLPRHDLFLRRPYCFPFAKRLPFVTVLTDFGCPFRCRFCVYSEIGYRTGELAGVFQELKYIRSLGVREIFFKDQTFCADRKRGEALCRFMIDNAMDFSWTCFLRVTQVKPDFLELLKDAGCHTVIFGAETASQDYLDKYHKQTSIHDIRRAVRATRQAGIRSVCTFILGFPDEDKASIDNTICFALELDPDYAAFNTYVPKTESMGFDLSLDRTHDQSGIEIGSNGGNGVLSGQEIINCRRRAVRRFYLRPRYILRKLLGIKSAVEFKMHLKSFFFVARDSR
jgi:anaerobic magnesium-protoporphyrin IX monomethyl ester cyclase